MLKILAIWLSNHMTTIKLYIITNEIKNICTVNFLGPFWPQKWGQIFDPEMAPC